MINDLKLGIQVFRYGLNVKGNIIAMVLFLGLGCVMEFLSPGMTLGGLYISLGSMMLIQLMHSVTVSTMVQTSPYKKVLQTVVPALMGTIFVFLANTLSIVLKLVGMQVFEWSEVEISNAILLSSAMTVLILVYMGAGLKIFWPATIAFFFAFVILYSTLNFGILSDEEVRMLLPMGLSILVSYLVVLAGCGIMYLIFLGTYKLEYSKVTWDAALKRAK